jgi:hypothetical protein
MNDGKYCVKAISYFIVTLILIDVYLSGRLQGQQLSFGATWALVGMGYTSLVIIFNADGYNCGYRWIDIIATLLTAICGVICYLLVKGYFPVYDGMPDDLFRVHYIARQTMQGILFFSIAFLSCRIVIKLLEKQNVISVSVWIACASYSIYMFLEFLYWRIVTGVPPIDELLSFPNMSAAEAYGLTYKQYLIIYIFMGVIAAVYVKGLLIYSFFKKIKPGDKIDETGTFLTCKNFKEVSAFFRFSYQFKTLSHYGMIKNGRLFKFKKINQLTGILTECPMPKGGDFIAIRLPDCVSPGQVGTRMLFYSQSCYHHFNSQIKAATGKMIKQIVKAR